MLNIGTEKKWTGKMVDVAFSILAIIVIILAFKTLHSHLKSYHYRDVVSDFRAIPNRLVMISLGFAIINYITLGCLETLSLQYAKNKLNFFKSFFVGFASYALSNNIGFASISGTTVRYHYYSKWGLSPTSILKIISFSWISFWIGLCWVGLSSIIFADPLATASLFQYPGLDYIAIIFLVAICFYYGLVLKRKKISFHDYQLEPPGFKLALYQLFFSLADWLTAGLVLYCLLPANDVSFFAFLGVFLLAQVLGVISHVPGGLGVFESLILTSFSGKAGASSIVAALVAYRIIYYILPLFITLIFFALIEFKKLKFHIGKISQKTVGLLSPLYLPVLSLAVFLTGIILVLSGATPAIEARLEVLGQYVPLSFIEGSHLLASLVGVSLMFLARAFQRQLKVAYYATLTLLLAGIVFSLVKGLDFEEALVLFVVMMMILPCRGYFYRKTSLFHAAFSNYSIYLVITVMLFASGFFWFGTKHVWEDKFDWLHFAVLSDAHRQARSMVSALGLSFLIILSKFLLRAPIKETLTTDDKLKLHQLIRKSESTHAYLGFLGDKNILFSEQKDAFIMYGIRGNTWVGMGDPIGDKKSFKELVLDFCDKSDEWNGKFAFYEVSPQTLPLFIELGFTAYKLGEEALIDLAHFSLDGPKYKEARYILSRFGKMGFEFSVLEPNEVNSHLQDLKTISNDWLLAKSTREKGFSLGSFKEDYLLECPVAVIRKDQKIIAFANLWTGANLIEISNDLMRYSSDAPKGIMDYLFVRLFIWARDAGYRKFNLGMAPLAGLETHDFAPVWNKVGTLIFKYGEYFYNFSGLRAYKAKFHPVWQPKYLVCRGGFAVTQILLDVSALVSGGYKGVFGK